MERTSDEGLVEVVRKAAREEAGKMKLACTDALKIAAQYEVKPIAVGQICNREGIKMCKCQLGCFG